MTAHPIDTEALQERIERELEEMFDGGGFDARDMAFDLAPIIAAEVRKARADALRDAADSVHDNAASTYCLPCHRDDADLLHTIADGIEKEQP